MLHGKFASFNQKYLPDLGSASDWLKLIFSPSVALPRSGSDASSEWNFCARFSDVISRENTVVASRNVTCFLRLQYVAQYPDGTSIRTLKTKTQFLRRPCQLSVNKVFRMKAEHFGFKMKVLAS